MKLLIDIGNTRWKFALWNNAIENHFSYLAKGFEIGAMDFLQELAAKPDSVWISSIRSESFNDTFAQKISKQLSVEPKFAWAEKSACGITTEYDSALGVDRFLALIAAWHEFQSACIVVDCGTAVTIDALDRSGVHRGGLIMPGLSMLSESLERGTDKLSAPDSESDEVLLATDTDAAIANGCRYMWSLGVSNTIRQVSQRIDASLIVVTGGDGSLLKQPQSQYRDKLVLEGLAVFAREFG